jgi:hypothetical protein
MTDNRSKLMVNQTSKKLLRNRINQVRLAKFLIQDRIDKMIEEIESCLDPTDYEPIISSLAARFNRIINSKKQKQICKFQRLVQEGTRIPVGEGSGHDKPALDPSDDKLVVNLSKRELEIDECHLLAKGLNYSITPSHVSNLELITSLEPGAHLLQTEKRDDYRCKIVNILNRPVNIKSNLTNTGRQCLNNIKKDDSIIVLPSERRGCCCHGQDCI